VGNSYYAKYYGLYSPLVGILHCAVGRRVVYCTGTWSLRIYVVQGG